TCSFLRSSQVMVMRWGMQLTSTSLSGGRRGGRAMRTYETIRKQEIDRRRAQNQSQRADGPGPGADAAPAVQRRQRHRRIFRRFFGIGQHVLRVDVLHQEWLANRLARAPDKGAFVLADRVIDER